MQKNIKSNRPMPKWIELKGEPRNGGLSPIYMREIEQYPLLSAEEEKELGKSIQDGLKAEKSLHTEGAGVDTEQAELWKAAVKAGLKAQEKMIQCNLRFVAFAAARMGHNYPDIMDAVQAGNMGLIKAVEHYNPSYDNRFATYAAWWIRQSIIREEPKTTMICRIPVNLYIEWKQIAEAENQAKMDGKSISDEEIAKQLKCTPEKIRSTRAAMIRPFSLDSRVGNDEDSGLTYRDLLRSEDGTDECYGSEWKQLANDEITTACERFLSERERFVIYERFGMNGGSPKSLRELSKVLGISGERVRQIQKSATAKLLKYNEKTGDLKRLLGNI